MTGWRTPINRRLVPTQDRNLVLDEGQIPLPLPPHPGAYGVKRKHHTHEGVDLYAPQGTPVLAVEAGTLVAIVPFTGSQAVPPSPWWRETEALLVEGPTGVVVYGEIAPTVGRRAGYQFQRGEPVGYVVQVLTKDKGYPMSMLHLELHEHGTRNAFDWVEEKPSSLKDPTPYLAASECSAEYILTSATEWWP